MNLTKSNKILYLFFQDYGYTRMKATNKTHIHFEQVSVDKNGQLIDSLWIVKDHNATYGRERNALWKQKSIFLPVFIELSFFF